jgi:hypothetical protein
MTTTDPDLADLLPWTSPDEFVAHVAGPDVRLEVVAGAHGGFDVALILDRGYSNFADAHAVAEWLAGCLEPLLQSTRGALDVG